MGMRAPERRRHARRALDWSIVEGCGARYPEQAPVVRVARCRGDLDRSSLLVESKLAPYEPR